eukprot:1993235-Prymnesium_polylepis.1
MESEQTLSELHEWGGGQWRNPQLLKTCKEGIVGQDNYVNRQDHQRRLPHGSRFCGLGRALDLAHPNPRVPHRSGTPFWDIMSADCSVPRLQTLAIGITTGTSYVVVRSPMFMIRTIRTHPPIVTTGKAWMSATTRKCTGASTPMSAG